MQWLFYPTFFFLYFFSVQIFMANYNINSYIRKNQNE
jgi:hypothetical protein